MSLLHLPEIRSYVRSNFNQSTPTGFISETEIDRWANEGYYKYTVQIMQTHEGYFEKTKLLNIVGGEEEITLPTNFANSDRKFLETTILERVLSDRNIPLEWRKRYFASDVNVTSGSAVSDHYLPTYIFRGNNIVLEPTPDSDEIGGLRLTFKAMPPKLRSGTAQGGSSTTITLDAGADPRDDYYNGARIFIISGTGSGQISEITDYVGSTKVATAAFSTAPDSTSLFSTLFDEDFPEIFHELVPLFATKCAFQKERSRGINVEFDTTRLKELEKDFQDFTESRTESAVFTRAWNLEVE